MLAIKTESLSKCYWIDENTNHRLQKWALKDVNIEIEEGDSVAVLGKNGSGKSTLLKILSRVVHPTTGQLKINGKIATLLEVGVGFHPNLTGRENIFLKGTLLGMSYQDIKRQLDAIIDFADIDVYLDTPVKRYSSGMYMRLGFAVAAHIRSEILVIDEALSVGDISFQQKCFRKINELRQEGRTIFMVSHSRESTQTLCNKAILLEKGEVAAMGSSLNVAAQYFEKNVETEKPAGLSESKNRFGNGKAKIKSIVFKDKFGNSIKELYCQEPLFITFEIEKDKDVNNEDIILSCAFGISFGQYLIVWSSNESNVFPKNKHLTLAIDTLDLRPGVYYFSYRLSIGTLADEQVADALENGFAFTVKDRENTRIQFPSRIGSGHFLND